MEGVDTSASLGLAISFTAGLLSFLSPCVLPLIPSYVTFITGLSLEDVQRSRRAALVHSLLFVLGFTLIFVAFGAAATGLGTLLVGVAFGAGWTPCIGPILGSILTYAASSADMSRGLWLLLAYSLGLAVPFLLAAVAVERFLGFFTRMKRQMNWITRTSGVLMIVVGILMITNYFTVLAATLQQYTPESLRSRL